MLIFLNLHYHHNLQLQYLISFNVVFIIVDVIYLNPILIVLDLLMHVLKIQHFYTTQVYQFLNFLFEYSLFDLKVYQL